MVAVAASLSLQKPCLQRQVAAKASSRAPRAAVRVQAVKQEQKVRVVAVGTCRRPPENSPHRIAATTIVKPATAAAGAPAARGGGGVGRQRTNARPRRG